MWLKKVGLVMNGIVIGSEVQGLSVQRSKVYVEGQGPSRQRQKPRKVHGKSVSGNSKS